MSSGDDELRRTGTYELTRVQSTRLRETGGPLESTSLRTGIVSNLEQPDQKHRRVIGFLPNDPENPHNWTNRRKWMITATHLLTVSNSTFNSSISSGAIPFIKDDFGVASTEVATLTMSMFLLGFVFGPVVCAPLSEFNGRKWVTRGFFGFFLIMTICCAVAPNMAVLLVFRFLAGVGASAPLSVGGGVLADLWPNPVIRGRIMAAYGAFTMIGPACSPFISGFVSNSALGWRMTFWIGTIVAALSFIPVLWCPETFAPVILLSKARRLRKAGETDVIAPLELEDRSLASILTTTITRPFRMFWQETIVLLTSLFLSLLYGTFYLFFQSFGIIYTGIYGFGPGFAGLPFLAVGFGSLLAIASNLPWERHLAGLARANKPVTDEYRRLPMACIACPIYVAAMFWQAWTARESVHYMVPVMAGVPFGFGFSIIFNCYINYLCDFYEIYAASALAAASMCRSLFGAAFPLFAPKMYANLGVGWATSLLGFLAAGMSVLPFLFIRYGDAIRARSKFRQFLDERKDMLEEEEEEEDDQKDAEKGKK